MTTFSAALSELVTLEEAVSITSPSALSIRKAYKYPPMNLNSSDVPCVINLMHQAASDVAWGMGRQELHALTLIRIVAGDMEWPLGAEIAHEFLYAMLDKLVDNTTLNGNAAKVLPVAAGPVGGLEYPEGSGAIWQRADLVVDIVFEEAKEFAA